MNAGAALKAVERHYSVLTPAERFKLVINAQVRGDDADLRRLVDSCPRFNYSLTDWAYRGHIEALHHVLSYVVLILRQETAAAAARTTAVELARELGARTDILVDIAWRMGYNAGAEAAGQDLDGQAGGFRVMLGDAGKDPYDLAEVWANMADDAGAELGANLGAHWAAFDSWSRDATGVDGAALLGGFHPGMPWVTVLIEMCQAAPVDQGKAEEFRAELAALWDRMLGE